jgi:hypothetical protein
LVCPGKERGEFEYDRYCKENIFFNEIAGAAREERKLV